MSHSPSLNRGIVVFSGGSAANNLVDVFNAVRENKKCSLSYIIPISDNGGSSSELIRVFGGPGIGDVRSRLVRLIPSSPLDSERMALKGLFNHRLSNTSPTSAKAEWYEIVEGTSNLWRGISLAKKELIRSFFNLLNLEIVKRARPSSTFDFTSASVGNLFLTGARIFSGSFESAIYLLASIGGVPEHTSVLPAINSNFSHHISAGLADGTTIVGQNSISHPSEPIALEDHPLSDTKPSSPVSPHDHPLQHYPHHSPPRPRRRQSSLALEYQDAIEDGTLPGSLPTLRKPYIAFSKSPSVEESLPARIERIWYINPYGQEIRPPSNPKLAPTLREAQAIVYSIGSLYTSIAPSLVLRGVGDAIRSSNARHKILILNGSLDREVGPANNPFTALDFVMAIVKAGEESRGVTFTPPPILDFLISPSENKYTITNNDTITSSPTTEYPPQPADFTPSASLLPPDLLPAGPPSIYRQYITHLLYLSGPGCPVVDKAALNQMGIECLRLYGRKIDAPENVSNNGTIPELSVSNSTNSVEETPVGMRYDPNALIGAIEAVLGRKGHAMVSGDGGRSRRNTLEG